MSCLILRTSSLGDVLQTFPAIHYLKSKGLSIDWVIEKRCAAVVKSHPDVENIIEIQSKCWPLGLASQLAQIRQKKYDYVFDFQGNCKSGLITFFAKAQTKIGWTLSTTPEWPNAFVTNKRHPYVRHIPAAEAYYRLAASAFDDHSPISYPGTVFKPDHPINGISKETLMICPASRWPNKQLRLETWQKLLDQTDRPLIISFGTLSEKSFAEKLAKNRPAIVLGNLPFDAWQALMRHVSGVVCVDSSALHLCGTTQTPSFTIFGPSSATVYKPLGDQHTSFAAPCPYDIKFSHRCPYLRTCKTGDCLNKVDEYALGASFTTWLTTLSPPSQPTKPLEVVHG